MTNNKAEKDLKAIDKRMALLAQMADTLSKSEKAAEEWWTYRELMNEHLTTMRGMSTRDESWMQTILAHAKNSLYVELRHVRHATRYRNRWLRLKKKLDKDIRKGD
jgi:hypothetical protein